MDKLRQCEQCRGVYNPKRVASGDYPYSRFCSATCQCNAGVLSLRDLLAAERHPLLTPEELEELVERFRSERAEFT